ncbi:MAG: fimbrillin family protein, partial [Tidjanibacter sp.]|nr:fimbrillin family protein [Tidjanibacter sp.]
MKKILFVALAAVGLTACVQNEELVVPQNTAAITFADAYVSNATKADPTTTTTSIAGFDVWAFMDEATGVVLEDEDVKKNGGVWSYDDTQYWFPDHTYYFAALSPMNSANVTETLATGDDAKLGLGLVEFTNANGTEDLLYAKAKVSTPQDNATLANQGMDPVNMHFQHLLSKVKFTFLNGFTTNNVTVAVSNVKMVAPKSATINLAQDTYNWANHAEAVTLEFGATEVLGATASGVAA